MLASRLEPGVEPRMSHRLIGSRPSGDPSEVAPLEPRKAPPWRGHFTRNRGRRASRQRQPRGHALRPSNAAPTSATTARHVERCHDGGRRPKCHDGGRRPKCHDGGRRARPPGRGKSRSARLGESRGDRAADLRRARRGRAAHRAVRGVAAGRAGADGRHHQRAVPPALPRVRRRALRQRDDHDPGAGRAQRRDDAADRVRPRRVTRAACSSTASTRASSARP